MARSNKATHALDAALLDQLRGLLRQASGLVNALSPLVSQGTSAVLRHGLETAAAQAKDAHESAHFGATEQLLWNGLCDAGLHGLDHQGQPCDKCPESPLGPEALLKRILDDGWLADAPMLEGEVRALVGG